MLVVVVWWWLLVVTVAVTMVVRAPAALPASRAGTRLISVSQKEEYSLLTIPVTSLLCLPSAIVLPVSREGVWKKANEVQEEICLKSK